MVFHVHELLEHPHGGEAAGTSVLIVFIVFVIILVSRLVVAHGQFEARWGPRLRVLVPQGLEVGDELPREQQHEDVDHVAESNPTENAGNREEVFRQ